MAFSVVACHHEPSKNWWQSSLSQDSSAAVSCNVPCHSDSYNSFLLCIGVDYSSRNVLTDPDLREGVKAFSEWPTIPQVYIDGEFVGGSDILMGMHESGELKKMFIK